MKIDSACPACLCCEYGESPRSAEEHQHAKRCVALKPKHKGIVCPQCSGVGPFRLVEDIRCWRPIYGLNAAGNLVVGSFYHTGEGYDDGNDMRLECHSHYVDERGIKVFCGHDFAMPLDVYDHIEWA